MSAAAAPSATVLSATRSPILRASAAAPAVSRSRSGCAAKYPLVPGSAVHVSDARSGSCPNGALAAIATGALQAPGAARVTIPAPPCAPPVQATAPAPLAPSCAITSTPTTSLAGATGAAAPKPSPGARSATRSEAPSGNAATARPSGATASAGVERQGSAPSSAGAPNAPPRGAIATRTGTWNGGCADSIAAVTTKVSPASSTPAQIPPSRGRSPPIVSAGPNAAAPAGRRATRQRCVVSVDSLQATTASPESATATEMSESSPLRSAIGTASPQAPPGARRAAKIRRGSSPAIIATTPVPFGLTAADGQNESVTGTSPVRVKPFGPARRKRTPFSSETATSPGAPVACRQLPS